MGMMGDDTIPPVYVAAVAAVERYGWAAVHGGRSEWTALHWAAAEGQAEICARLLRCGADPKQPDNFGRSAFDYAREGTSEATWQTLAAFQAMNLQAVTFDLDGAGTRDVATSR